MSHFLRPEKHEAALAILDAALDAAQPGEAIRRVLRVDGDRLWVDGRLYEDYDDIYVIGAGKAGAAMAQAVEGILGDRIAAGLVIVKDDHLLPTRWIALREAGHPVPDARGVAASQEMVDLVRGRVGKKSLILCLISGGGSALMTLPAAGIGLDDLSNLTGALLRSGAPIQDINTVRKHLSQVAGGGLARLAAQGAYPATVITLILSDVIGSSLDVIASGPTVPDPTTFADARRVLERYGIGNNAPQAILDHLHREALETPKAGDPVFAAVQNVIVADNSGAALAAARQAEALGYHTLLLSTFIEGEAREVAKVLAGMGKEILFRGRPVPRPACLICGGETTVTLRGAGRGGRNQELTLAAALAVQGLDGIVIGSLATDGTDGPTDAAGGLIDGTTVARGQKLGLSAQAALDNNDAYPYLDAVGDLLVTGPTHTNVNDIMVVLVDG